MFARSLGPRARRRGIVLVLILGMLGLVALIGVTFATFAGQSLKSSRDFMQGVARPSSEVLMDYALAQLINDTSNPLSALRGHSLLRDMYGNDSVFRGADPTISGAAAIKGHLDHVYLNGTPQLLSLTAGVLPNSTSGTPYYNQAQYTTNIPIGGQYYGLNFTRWILTFPSTTNTAVTPPTNYAAQTFEILEDTLDTTNGVHVFTLSNNQGNPATKLGVPLGTPIAGALPSTDNGSYIWNNPNLVEDPSNNIVRTQVLLTGSEHTPLLSSGEPTAFPLTGFTLDCQYMRAFNGPGLTRPDYTTTAVYPGNYAAYANFRLNGLDPDAMGMDEDYDACDLENWYLAIQSADGQVIVPSFHRPGILMVDASNVSDWSVLYNTGNTAQDALNQKRASKILRPRQIDHSPLFPTDPRPDPASGKITFDVDNDGDGITDSVWLDLGYPVQRDPGGKLYKPLFAFMVIGLNGRLPLNTVGNLQARAHGNPIYDPTNPGLGTSLGTDPAVAPTMTGSQVAVPYPGAYATSGTFPYTDYRFASMTWTDAPVWDHASHLGYSVNEINPKYALQNAPLNVNYYPPVAPTDPFPYQGLLPGPRVKYSQLDDAGMDVALTQLRNLLAGTVPTDLKNPFTGALSATSIGLNYDTNHVAVDGKPWIFPNNVLDSGDYSWSTGSMSRTNGAVAGRWGEPEGIPTTFSLSADLFANASTTPIAQYTNPIRAGRSHYLYGANDIMDDDYDSVDPYFAPINQSGLDYPAPVNPVTPPPGWTNLKVIRNYPEDTDSFDGIGQRSIASERMRGFRTPIDPSASGRVVGYMHRPVDAHDQGLGYDVNGRVGFFRYFRPAGMPQRISYPYPSVAAPDYNIPMFSPATGPARSMNRLNGYQQALLPGNYSDPAVDPESRNVAVMAAMPFDWKADPTNPSPPTPAPPSGYDPLLASPTINPSLNTLLTKVNTDWGPNLGGAVPPSPAYLAVGPFGYNTATNLGVVNGYLGGSLNKDEADEMNLYNPSLYDQPFGPSDLEWLYRKHDVDGASLTSRLSSLAPISFLNPADGLTRRRLFSVDSWEPISFVYAHDNPSGYAHEQVPYVVTTGTTRQAFMQPRFQFNSRFSPRANASFYGMNQVAFLNPAAPNPNPISPGFYATGIYNNEYVYNFYTHANPIATEFIPNPTLPMNPNPNNTATAGTSIFSYIPNLGATAVPLPAPVNASGGSVFTTEYAPNAAPLAYSALSASGVPVQTPPLAHRDRRINLNYPLPTSNDPAEPVRQKWIRETYQLLKAILPPQSVDTPEELAALSQYVVNIIDFRDPDGTATRFVNTDLETVPAADDKPAGVRFATPAVSPLLDPYQPYDPNLYVVNPDATNPQTRYLVQHGMEYSPVAINEVLAYSHIYGSGGSSNDNNRLYIELVNTLTDDEGTGRNCDIDLAGWDVVVTPDAYGWGRPNPITGQVTGKALPAVQRSTTPDPAKPPQPTTTPLPTNRLQRVNGGTGLPGYIFGKNATDSTLANTKVDSPLRVRAMDNSKADASARRYFILANEAANGGAVGSGSGLAPANAESAPIKPVDYTPAPPPPPPAPPPPAVPQVDGLIPDYVLPYGPSVTASGPSLTYQLPGPITPTGVGNYFWVYLRRPANPFDTGKLTDANPNREMVVVDSMRFRFVEAGGKVTPTKGNNDISSTQRLQPYRGGHRVPPNTVPGPTTPALPPGTTIAPPSPRHAYGYSEQTGVGTTGSNVGQYGSGPYTTITNQIDNTLGKANDNADSAWAHLPFHDRDFASVAELLLVPGCPPGLFTKQFVEEPYPGNTGGTGYDDADLPVGSITPPSGSNVGRKDFNVTSPAVPVPSFPYLPDAFYYSAASVAPPETPTTTMTQFPTEVGGWTGAGWFKMFEFFEVPSSANGATGLAANGVDFDWYRQDVKPGLMNLNLVIDEEAFFGIIDDDRLSTALAAANYTTVGDYYNHLPAVVTEVDANGYPAVLASTSGVPTVLARYPISDISTINSVSLATPYLGRGFVYRDPNASATLVHGLKAAFSDFLKIRHGGSGHLFAFGSGMPGSGTYVATSEFATDFSSMAPMTTTAIASERPFRSLSFPDINYTVMRPASLPPSIYPANLTVAGITNPLPTWSYPPIPIDTGTSTWGGTTIAAGTGLARYDTTLGVWLNLLNYSAAPADPFVTLTPAESPSRASTPFQYVFDPGLKNPFLARQDRPGANLPPKQANFPAVPPTPARRLFQVPDNDGSTLASTASASNASLYGTFSTNPSPLYQKYDVNQQATDLQLTTRDASVFPPGIPPSLVLGDNPTPGINARNVLMPDNQLPDARSRFLFLGGNLPIGTGNTDNRQHPLYRTEWLQKVMNLTTVRTHQFAVWITVGFFEVAQLGTPELGVVDKLGAELNSAAGAKVRFRSFFVLDRTRAKGFNPYYPGDFRDVVTYRRRIE